MTARVARLRRWAVPYVPSLPAAAFPLWVYGSVKGGIPPQVRLLVAVLPARDDVERPGPADDVERPARDDVERPGPAQDRALGRTPGE